MNNHDYMDMADDAMEKLNKIRAIMDLLSVSKIEFLDDHTMPSLCGVTEHFLKKIEETIREMSAHILELEKGGNKEVEK